MHLVPQVGGRQGGVDVGAGDICAAFAAASDAPPPSPLSTTESADMANQTAVPKWLYVV